MTRNILESDEVDSKIFEGRVITLLGEIIQTQVAIQKFLATKLFNPPDDSPANYEAREYEEESYSDIDEGDDLD